MSKSKKRKTHLVDWQVQGTILRQAIIQWFLFASVGALLFGIFQILLGGGPQKPWSHHWQATWPMAASMFVSLLLLMPKFVIDSLKMSNRFTGPIVRLRQTLREIAAGKPYKKITFRDSDLWREVADELDDALTEVRRVASRGSESQATSDSPGESSPAEIPELGEPVACA